jgi:hypothetical protein
MLRPGWFFHNVLSPLAEIQILRKEFWPFPTSVEICCNRTSFADTWSVISIVRVDFRVCHFRSYCMVLSEKVRRPLVIAVSREPQGTLRTM